MAKPDTTLHLTDTATITVCAPANQTRIHVLDGGGATLLLQQETLEEIPFPAQLALEPSGIAQDIAAAGVVVIPFPGGGRGPIINFGEVVSLELLHGLLLGSLAESHLRPELQARLDTIPLPIPNSKAQQGYATHNDLIILDNDWSGRPPKIELSLSHGALFHTIETQVGVAPDCVTYVEIPGQEVLYGHSGVVLNNRFTVKAAILTKTLPTVVPLNWTPAVAVGPPVTALTALSPITNTAVSCMGLRIKGTLGLSNTAAYAVAGSMYAQLSVDGGPWVNIAELTRSFDATGNDVVTEQFDVLMAYDQAPHTYQFRGQLMTDSAEETNRRLTGSLHIATVAESGSGIVLSNDLQIKWSCKE